MAGTYNPATGRTMHLTDGGREVESKPLFFTAEEWALLYSLSKDSGVSLGKCIVEMAKKEKRRRLNDYENRLDNLSN